LYLDRRCWQTPRRAIVGDPSGPSFAVSIVDGVWVECDVSVGGEMTREARRWWLLALGVVVVIAASDALSKISFGRTVQAARDGTTPPAISVVASPARVGEVGEYLTGLTWIASRVEANDDCTAGAFKPRRGGAV
jgi:hypothetical protein